MKWEKLEWLATPPTFTRRFEDEIGYRLRDTPISTVADLLDLGWDQVKRIEMAYMRRLVDATPIETPRVIGVDEIAIKKRHQYRIVVSDLERRRPIWFGGKDRSRNVSMKVRQICFAFSDSRMRRSWSFPVVGPGHAEGAAAPQAG